MVSSTPAQIHLHLPARLPFRGHDHQSLYHNHPRSGCFCAQVHRIGNNDTRAQRHACTHDPRGGDRSRFDKEGFQHCDVEPEEDAVYLSGPSAFCES
ncbi:hypothetical protein I7I53_07212 [Histoplasma capsulatum var. duboisii H88]|uniref:Uncharacterized protein n=2 Tax=Ajellomyces capsulatus TaxID=5037 RepID=A0A8H7ZAF0_AJECA|nr:hypothetical protein I7I52_02415 [Histoplasma capsulatum]QSS51788.1 hypothetical protein I7I53_07212 [Histoplasma capsulatum var. duboisii H88]QSS69769.1 hypothetical protein I7I50_11177 [Histoplasma capsulatum G186AR]